jgi:tRNA (guanine-N7-)-methyltransferase
VLAAKKIEQQTISNILLMREHGEFIDEYLPHNSIDCMHINFPDPWSKKSRRKHRILSADFLTKMYPYFRYGGELRFKTDHLEYFETVTSILGELKLYTILEHTTDLYGSDYNGNNILTEFEMLFKSKGNPPIGYLRAETL